MTKPPPDEFDEAEAKRRYEQALKGAFKTPPQPLDDIPKKRPGVQRKRAVKKKGAPSST